MNNICAYCRKPLKPEIKPRANQGKTQKESPIYETIETQGMDFCSQECVEKYREDAKIKGMLKILEQITSEREKALKTFDRRIGTLNSHKHYINQLTVLVHKYKKEGTKYCDDIIKILDKIRKEVITEFADYLKDEIDESERQRMAIQRDEAMMKDIEIAEYYDYQKLRKLYNEGGTRAEAAKRQIMELMQSIQQGMENKKLEMHIEEHLSSIMGELDKIIKQQKEAITEETTAIQSLKEIMQKRLYKVTETEIIMGIIIEYFMKLYGSLYGEKERVIMPFEKFLKEKRTLENRIKKYKQRGMITKEDIFRDIQTMKTASEVAEYLRWIRRFIPEMRQKGVDDKKARQLERLWELTSSQNIKAIMKVEIKLEDMKIEAYKDPTFNIWGVKAFQEKLSETVKKYERITAKPERSVFRKAFNGLIDLKSQEERARFILVCFDIDNFKTYNEAYSYEIGDKIIAKVIDLVRNKIKKIDFFARYGGEEFAIIIEEADKEKIAERMDEIRQAIFNNTQQYMKELNEEMVRDAKNPEIFSKLEEFLEQVRKVAAMGRGDKIQMPYISISIGLVEYPIDTGKTADWEKVKTNAEELLKKAKETPYTFWNINFTGRNQLCYKEGTKIRCINPSNTKHSD